MSFGRRHEGKFLESRQPGDPLARLSDPLFFLSRLRPGLGHRVLSQSSRRSPTRTATVIESLEGLKLSRVGVEGVGEFHVPVIRLGLEVVVGDQGETPSSHFILSHTFDAQPLQLGLEIVQHDGVGETFEHQT